MNFRKYYLKFKIYTLILKIYITNLYNGIFKFNYQFPIYRRITGLFETDKTEREERKKLNDKRGHQTQLLHTIAKEIKQENNETPYKDCLKQAGEKLKTKDIFII